MSDLDSQHRLIAREFLRAMRGRRSQTAASRRFGYRTNVCAEWESGRRVPRLRTLQRTLTKLGVDLPKALAEFWPPAAHALASGGIVIAPWLTALAGRNTLTTLARRAGLSRHQVARLLRGETEPRVHQFFALIDACTGRLVDLLAGLVDIQLVPSLREEHQRVSLSRRLAFEEPWTCALLAAVECVPERDVPSTQRVLASTFGLSMSEVERCLELLVRAGVLSRDDRGYTMARPLLVDTGVASTPARRLTAHWFDVGTQRAFVPRPSDAFSFNVFSLSHEDLARIGKMQHEYFQSVRAIIAASKPETVALMNLQLVHFPLEDGAEVTVPSS